MAIETTAESEQHRAPPESNGFRWVILVAFAVFVSLGFLIVYSRFLEPVEQTGVDHPGVGNQLTVLKVEPFIDADQSFTQADLKGNVTLINYWGPWCPPCRIEMPHMVEIEKKYHRHGQFQFLSVTCGIWVYSSLEAMRIETTRYRDQAKLDFPLYFDPDFTSRASLESATGMEPQEMGYPTTVLIDQQGRIAGVWEGFSTSLPDQIVASVDRLISPR
ncbi:MAG: TlpA disulfide reductase family protein [Pirellulaceae bacterium]|jgi:thiol-disulfide isomerase/thioredoxin|nr:TlpA disulfide reductase family protein [Pirellulaceae bacterium]HJN13165.1 TlpA disulfide reductase family protein [Pirellulaceae bacterium]